MKTLIAHWLSSGNEKISLFEDTYEIVLSRRASVLLLCVQLTHAAPDNKELHCWMRLGGASLNHFQGALAQLSTTGALWLVQTVQGTTDTPFLLSIIESMLNQRDTWHAIVARLNKPTLHRPATSLRSRLY